MFAASPGLKHHPVLRVRARADQPATMPTTRLIVVAGMTVPYAFLVTYQTYYLPAGLGGSRQRPATDLPRRRAGLRPDGPTEGLRPVAPLVYGRAARARRTTDVNGYLVGTAVLRRTRGVRIPPVNSAESAPTVRRPIDAMGRPLPVRTDPMSGRDNGHRG